jgi:hypothetical protein
MSFQVAFPNDVITLHSNRVPDRDALRQENTAREILRRLERQPGLILADEVGMGKTFVALAVAAAVALTCPEVGPVVVMVPSSLKDKWPKEWAVFKDNCLKGEARSSLTAASADSGIAFLKLLDDDAAARKQIIFLTHGALNRSLTDEWVKLAIIRRALSRRTSMEQVRRALPRFAGRLLRSQWIDNKAPDLWEQLLERPPDQWKRIIQRAGLTMEDDPVPKALTDAMDDLDDFKPLLEALDRLPLRESSYVDERLSDARQTLADALKELWRVCLNRAKFRAPLLILDEAHHLKNVTQLSSLFANEEAGESEETVNKGPLGGVFSRMLFLTATPFQLGHRELINVLRRFDGIAWDGDTNGAMSRDVFRQSVDRLEQTLSDTQAASLRLDRTWGRLKASHLESADGRFLSCEEWWSSIRSTPATDDVSSEICTRFDQCNQKMREAETSLRPWVIRHLKPRTLPSDGELEPINRRELFVGAGIKHDQQIDAETGLQVEGEALLPFLLAVRAQVALASKASNGLSKRAVFAEGLASSYEAYLETRQGRAERDDDDPTSPEDGGEDPEIAWYLNHLDRVLPQQSEEAKLRHPKVLATIERVVQLWWRGEKTLIFCHYRATGRALRRHISWRLEQDILNRAVTLLNAANQDDARRQLENLGEAFFDSDGEIRKSALELMDSVVSKYSAFSDVEKTQISAIAMRFFRTPYFLIRYFPLQQGNQLAALDRALDVEDESGLTYRHRLDNFCHFLSDRCVPEERKGYIDSLKTIPTGLRAESVDSDDSTDDIRYLPTVRLANGEVKSATRRRLMLAFNTPFFPEILIASSVLAEGVDLHLECRFVIHHDLCWNPSTIEQRTGRVDRIGGKSERARQPIHVYLPFVTATQDEKMFRVVRDRERWFSVIMGEKYTVDEASTEKLAERVPFPETAAKALAFDLSLQDF